MSEPLDKASAIKEAAKELFNRYGYSKTSLEDIARAAHIGKGTIYYYFKNKEDIFLDSVQDYSVLFLKELQKQVDDADTLEAKLSAYIRTPLILIKEHLWVLNDALNSMPTQYLSKLEGFREGVKIRVYSILSEILDFGIEVGLIDREFPSQRVIEIINDWFLLADNNISVVDKEKLVLKIERGSDWIIKIILYGIVKRG